VETAKRALSGRPVAIGLHDTLNKEFSRLHDHDDFHLPDHQSDQPYGGYDAILQRVEEASKVCCALVATLAYWGNETSDQWWIDELERFSTHARGGGLAKQLKLRLVAGSALYYSAGVSALSARRYDLLARLLDARRPSPHRNELELLAVALDADAAYSESSGHGTRISPLVRPLLRESLAISDGALDDAWQRFEIIRLAKGVMGNARFDARLASFKEMDAALAGAQKRFEEAEQVGLGVDNARQERVEASHNRGRAMGAIADAVPLGRPHILSVDLRGDDHYRSPVAERLANGIAAEGDTHPLVKAQLAADPTALSIAISAVSVAVGRRGDKLAWGRLPSGGGIVPMEIWLDTGQTPDELALKT